MKGAAGIFTHSVTVGLCCIDVRCSIVPLIQAALSGKLILAFLITNSPRLKV